MWLNTVALVVNVGQWYRDEEVDGWVTSLDLGNVTRLVISTEKRGKLSFNKNLIPLLCKFEFSAAFETLIHVPLYCRNCTIQVAFLLSVKCKMQWYSCTCTSNSMRTCRLHCGPWDSWLRVQDTWSSPTNATPHCWKYSLTSWKQSKLQESEERWVYNIIPIVW